MARRIVWSPRALSDLHEILEWIARDSQAYARAVHDRFFARVESLTDQPGQGRRVPEYEGSDTLREVFVHSWRLMYRFDDRTVSIVAIVHGARDFGNVPPV
jgi:toxin ParE1/3/4